MLSAAKNGCVRDGPSREGARGCAGFTLIESLVALSMFIVVLIAVLSASDFAVRDANNEAERNVAISDVTTGIARIVAELRRVYQVNAPVTPIEKSESSYLDVMVRVPGSSAKRLLINCAYKEPGGSYDECVRYESPASEAFTAGTPPAGATPEAIVPRVLNETSADEKDAVFKKLSTPSGTGKQPTYGVITIHTPGKGGLSTSNYAHQVEISDAFYIRNLDYGRA